MTRSASTPWTRSSSSTRAWSATAARTRSSCGVPRATAGCGGTDPQGSDALRSAGRRRQDVDRAGAVVELVVEVHRGADQREVTERLREVADLLTCRPDLLRVQPEVVAVGQHLLEGEPRRVEAPGPGQRTDVPERAHREDRKSTRLNS